MKSITAMYYLKIKLILLFVVKSFFFYSQQTKKVLFPKEGSTIEFLKHAEVNFEVFYSYSNDLLLNKSLYLNELKLSLEEFHLILNSNNNLQVIHVKNNYYAILEATPKNSTIELSEVVVNGYLMNSIKKDLKKISFRSFENEVLPGVTDFDVVRAFHYLPGVKSPNQTATSLHVKGGKPDQNLLLWNKINIYHHGHLFGMISPINEQMVDIATFHYSYIPLHLGTRTSSVINLTTSLDKINKEFVKFGIDLLNVNLSQKKAFFNEKLYLRYALRKSLTPFYNSTTYKSYTQKLFQNSDFSLNNNQSNFSFWDAAIVLDYSINNNTNMSVSSMYIDNYLEFLSNNSMAKQQIQKMNINNFGSSLQVNSKLNEKTYFGSSLQFSKYNYHYNNISEKETRTDNFLKQNEVFDLSLDLSIKHKISENLNYFFGCQINNYSINHQIRNDNENLGFTISEKNNNLISNAILFNTEFKKNDIEALIGAKITSNQISSLLFEPKLNLTYRFNNNFQSMFAFEQRSQFLQQINENIAGDNGLEDYVWILSDQFNLPMLKSNNLHLGFLLKNNASVVDLDVFYKRTEGITSFSNGVVFSSNSMSNSLELISNGYNISRGVDFSFQKEISKLKFWISYSFLNSKNKFNGINNGNYFKSNDNISHSVNITSKYQFSDYFFSIGWLWNSGRPYSVLDENRNIIFFNTENLNHFHSLDFSFSYSLLNENRKKIKTGLALNNIYNNRVIINKEISRLYETAIDLVNPRYKTSDFYSLGFTYNMFLKFSF